MDVCDMHATGGAAPFGRPHMHALLALLWPHAKAGNLQDAPHVLGYSLGNWYSSYKLRRKYKYPVARSIGEGSRVAGKCYHERLGARPESAVRVMGILMT